ncbi:unnamed protein product [Caenorhabditis auriculariae]|uniref:lysoplasmalogenase n=1 Tax=Caenorhabditis auriculariae TaxID=2777116 RepID=A0A8S1HG14_9PELO|nr:unnamed protein product [Caenorhabditis auriculariae]
MRSTMIPVGFVYFLLVANFYNESAGFDKDHTPYYSLWKVTPIASLAGFSLFHGAGLSDKDRLLAGLGLIFGGIGDYVIGSSNEGIVAGAIAFGIGHVFYLMLFMNYQTKVHQPLVAAMIFWGAVISKVCFLPLLEEHPIAMLIMASYAVLLTSCFVIAASQYLNGTATQNEKGVWIRALGFLSTPYCDFLVLGSYYLAQYLILYGNIVAKVTPTHKKVANLKPYQPRSLVSAN